MRKILLMCLIAVVALMLGTSAMARNTTSCNCQPQGLTCDTSSGTYVAFDWTTVDCADCDSGTISNPADKYSVEVRYEDEYGDTLLEQDFGTGDEVDPTVSALNVDFADLSAFLAYCSDSSVDLKATVKALEDLGNNKKRQNNPHSADCTFSIPCP